MPTTSQLRVRIFDGSRQLFAAPAKFLVTITDGHQTQQFRDYIETPDTTFSVPFFDNLGDNYTVLVWAEGFQQAGFTPVKLSNSYTRVLDLMLIRKDPGFSFVNARFPEANAAYPFIGAGLDNPTGEANYDKLVEEEKPLACLLNICEAMSQIALPHQTPLNYMKQLIWGGDLAPAQDRFFAWCDPELIQQIQTANGFDLMRENGAFCVWRPADWNLLISFMQANGFRTADEDAAGV